MEVFEGYIGISKENGQLIYDILLLLLFVLLSIFSYTFRTCYPLFEKMIRGFFSVKERQSLFDTPRRESFFFNIFMGFQTLFLCTVFSFLVFCRFSEILEQTANQSAILLTIFFCILILFYIFKRFIYFIFGYVMLDKEKFKLWHTTYHTLFNLWGISLYLPVFWLMLDRERIAGSLIIFIFNFILFRLSVIYMKIRIFYNKNNGFLFLNLYLCAQEIIPLLFLYESLTYLYNVFKTSILWQ